MTNITLEELNNEKAKEYMGGVIFVAILMVIGFLGNLHVLIVYTFFMKPSNHRIFILVLGTLDFITCVVGMPFIIVDLRNHLTFTSSSACKILNFTNYFICTSSVLTLVVIAADRYRKICVPLKQQITQHVAKLLCCLVMLVALLFSWPVPILYGTVMVQTEHNITGSRCGTEKKENYDKYQSYFNITLTGVACSCFIALVILYFKIGQVIIRRSGSSASNKRQESQSTKQTDVSLESATSTERETPTDYGPSSSENKKRHNNVSVETQKNNSKEQICDVTTATKAENQQNTRNLNRAKKTTLMFFVISVVFILSYMPHLTLQVLYFMDDELLLKMSFTGRVFYHTFLFSIFINNMSNCFIYGFFDERFRDRIKHFYQRLNCRR